MIPWNSQGVWVQRSTDPSSSEGLLQVDRIASAYRTPAHREMAFHVLRGLHRRVLHRIRTAARDSQARGSWERAHRAREHVVGGNRQRTQAQPYVQAKAFALTQR